MCTSCIFWVCTQLWLLAYYPLFTPRMDPLLHKLAASTKLFVKFAFEKIDQAERRIDRMEKEEKEKGGKGDSRELSVLEKMIIKNQVTRVGCAPKKCNLLTQLHAYLTFCAPKIKATTNPTTSLNKATTCASKKFG